MWTFAGEYLGLTGSRLNGKELVAAGLATHFVPLEVSLAISLYIYVLMFKYITSVIAQAGPSLEDIVLFGLSFNVFKTSC